MKKRTKAFTLIELLVVVAIITLLMALLFPALGRARKQAQAVACQARLRQWALILNQYTSENEGRFLGAGPRSRRRVSWLMMLEPYFGETLQLAKCPAKDVGPSSQWHVGYGMNGYLLEFKPEDPTIFLGLSKRWNADTAWAGLDGMRHRHTVPVLLDRRRWVGGFCYPISQDGPPLYEDCMPTSETIDSVCSPRHGSSVNTLFLDWSVRRVRLKELWTLKWHRQFDTAGPWTKRGGVVPEDWP